MADLYHYPVNYGIEDVTIPGENLEAAARIYYPTELGWFWGAPVRSSRYPLVVFPHFGIHWEALDEDVSVEGLLAWRGDRGRVGGEAA